MANSETSFLTYKGKPLVRKGNTIYYGDMNDPFVLMFSIADSHEVHGVKDFTASHAVDNPASGRVMEKCGLKFESFGEHSKRDGSMTYKIKKYRLQIDWGVIMWK